ncbi:hypothetical protein EVAR_59030_1 [Eumeta japonica]|uniref:Uncharacterized protein n=1 Tax=Eumeta variegata TaxID=151549 RepID=A0A4C1ZFL5_EUMVA|nr:hypothetical protein EVAR_59030_1 [Eumeta japonica]
MDIENGSKDDQSSENGELLVFTGVQCSTPLSMAGNKQKYQRTETQFTDTILSTCPAEIEILGVRISKEKKAERTASNQALSLNMMKFLNQTASGSTVPSESIASTSTQQTSEIPLGNAPDALSTESELQLDVELGSCSSQSKMDTEILVLSSSNQEEQVLDSPIAATTPVP